MLPNPQIPAHLVTFAEEILNGKIHFLCSEMSFFFFLRKRAQKNHSNDTRGDITPSAKPSKILPY